MAGVIHHARIRDGLDLRKLAVTDEMSIHANAKSTEIVRQDGLAAVWYFHKTYPSQAWLDHFAACIWLQMGADDGMIGSCRRPVWAILKNTKGWRTIQLAHLIALDLPKSFEHA